MRPIGNMKVSQTFVFPVDVDTVPKKLLLSVYRRNIEEKRHLALSESAKVDCQTVSMKSIRSYFRHL